MLARDGIFSAKFRGCTVRATARCGGEPNGTSVATKEGAADFFASEPKFIRLPLDNAGDSSREKIC
jgi:hypothetical protein